MVFSPTRPSCIFPSDIFFSKGPDCIGCTSCDATGAPPSALFLTLSTFIDAPISHEVSNKASKTEYAYSMTFLQLFSQSDIAYGIFREPDLSKRRYVVRIFVLGLKNPFEWQFHFCRDSICHFDFIQFSLRQA